MGPLVSIHRGSVGGRGPSGWLAVAGATLVTAGGTAVCPGGATRPGGGGGDGGGGRGSDGKSRTERENGRVPPGGSVTRC